MAAQNVDTSSGLGDAVATAIGTITDWSFGIAHFAHNVLGFGAFGSAAFTVATVTMIVIYVLGKVTHEFSIYSPAKIAGFSILAMLIAKTAFGTFTDFDAALKALMGVGYFAAMGFTLIAYINAPKYLNYYDRLDRIGDLLDKKK